MYRSVSDLIKVVCACVVHICAPACVTNHDSIKTNLFV